MEPNQFSVIVADPPWRFNDKCPGPGRGAEKHYGTMSVDEICALPVERLAAPDSLLFLWRVASMQAEALEVVRAWGFTLKAELVWVKTSAVGNLAFGMGHYVRAAHETCLIARRGKGAVKHRSQRSVFMAPRREHSRKPDEFYAIVERLTDGPRLEMFCRGDARTGWHAWGDQATGNTIEMEVAA